MHVDLEVLSRSRLRIMSRAGEEVFDALRVLGKAGTNPVAQVLAHQGKFFEEDHYPKGDVYDGETGAQYYYHAHRGPTGEHGHFHTFIRGKGIPSAARPAAVRSAARRPRGKAEICHLIAISMNRAGLPIGLFTTNQWVTGETLFSAQDTIQMLDRFQVDHVHPCLATNRWISAMLRLFRPEIKMLLLRRDAKLGAWQGKHPDRDPLLDEELEVTSSVPIDIDRQVARVDRLLGRRSSSRAIARRNTQS
jgi:hypothetical protein